MTARVWQDDHLDTEVDGVHVLMRRGKRDEQQDAVFVGSGVVAVADGLGGHRDGRAASKVAVDAFAPTISEPLHLDTFSCDIADTAGLLLCTDGLSGPLDAAWQLGGTIGDVELVDDDVGATVAALLTDRGIRGLVELATQLGGDNVTAVWWPL